MTPLIKEKLDDIVHICKEMQVNSLYLFGSGTREKGFHKDSDFDFLFRFKKDEKGISFIIL